MMAGAPACPVAQLGWAQHGALLVASCQGATGHLAEGAAGSDVECTPVDISVALKAEGELAWHFVVIFRQCQAGGVSAVGRGMGDFDL